MNVDNLKVGDVLSRPDGTLVFFHGKFDADYSSKISYVLQGQMYVVPNNTLYPLDAAGCPDFGYSAEVKKAFSAP